MLQDWRSVGPRSKPWEKPIGGTRILVTPHYQKEILSVQQGSELEFVTGQRSCMECEGKILQEC